MALVGGDRDFLKAHCQGKLERLTTCKCCTPKRKLCCWFSCGAVSFILTVFFALAVGLNLSDELFYLIMKKELQLVPGSSVLDDWADNADMPAYKIFYIFDTQNPDEYSQGAVPVVREVGPFAYREYDKKVNLKWNSDESLVTYNREQYYIFVPEKSIGDPRDYNVTVLNFPLLMVLNQQQRVEGLLRLLGSAFAQFYLTLIGDQALFVEKTAQEFIWGYPDPILWMLQLLGLVDHPDMRAQANQSDPTLLYTVNTGKNDIDAVDSLVRWRNMTQIADWGSADARQLYGSISGRFQPRLEKHDTVVVFIEALYRHVRGVYTSKASLYGIDLYRYEGIHTAFSNSSEYPPNVGYYAYDLKYGLINLTAVVPLNLPMYFSKPHCLSCDPEYFKNVSGYHPDKSKHETYVRNEPFTGIGMEGAIRGQRNIRIQRNSLSRQLSHVPETTYYPWFYTSKEVTIAEDKADDFKHDVLLPRTILKIFVILLLCASGVTMLCVVGVLLRSYRNHIMWAWTSMTSQKSPKKSPSSSPVAINNSDESKSPLLNGNRTTDYHTITQSRL